MPDSPPASGPPPSNQKGGESVQTGGGLPIRARTVSFVAAPDDVGQRLDQLLAKRIEGLSRRQARTLLDLGGVFVNKVRTKFAARPTQAGDEVTAYIGGALSRAKNQVGTAAREEDAAKLPAYEVMFEDEDIVVVNKPAGLLTAPTPESDRNNLADLLSRRGPRRSRLFVVHRLDLQTSGVLVFAKSPWANRVLSERFAVHDMFREYLAVVAGAFPGDVATIDRPVGGKRAVTHVEVAERLGELASVLRLRLETGRTHQIRLHVRSLGCQVLGDPDVPKVKGLPVPPRMALHAARLEFAHPVTREALAYEAPVPVELGNYITKLRAGAAEPSGPSVGPEGE
ncbi:MAG: RluA family pseudouridine synthase [Deltaproteobacteria bacterium]|nr:RluA family pseudouridine synthase [Deltaproteobacteria bacterium]